MSFPPQESQLSAKTTKHAQTCWPINVDGFFPLRITSNPSNPSKITRPLPYEVKEGIATYYPLNWILFPLASLLSFVQICLHPYYPQSLRSWATRCSRESTKRHRNSTRLWSLSSCSQSWVRVVRVVIQKWCATHDTSWRIMTHHFGSCTFYRCQLSAVSDSKHRFFLCRAWLVHLSRASATKRPTPGGVSIKVKPTCFFSGSGQCDSLILTYSSLWQTLELSWSKSWVSSRRFRCLCAESLLIAYV